MTILQKAAEYFASRLEADIWDSAGDSSKSKALAQAERQLEPYRNRANSTQFFYAVFEQALWLLQGDKRAELQQAGVMGFSVGNISEQFDTKGRRSHIAPGAWIYLQGSGVKAGQIK
jgi:hypothetical protein